MTKQVISVGGEEHVVREDTAKAFRGVHWALLSIALFVVIMLVLLLSGVIKLASDDRLGTTPAEVEQQRQ